MSMDDELNMFMSTLHGEVKLRFEILLDQCNEAIQLNEKHDERIYELEGHAREYADEIATLTQALEEEHDLRLAIEVSNLKLEESHKIEMDRLISDRDVAQSVANDLRLQNEKLNQIITKSATKFSSSTIVSTSCSTNPSCEKAPSTQDKILDELLNAQKKHGDKTGLGYVSKSKKSKSKKNKNKKKKKIPAPSSSQTTHTANDLCFDVVGNVFGEEEEYVREVVGNAKKAMPNHNNFAGKYNPSYVLCRSYDGHVYAKFVGSSNEYIAWSIWVPKTLVTNTRGPIEKWVPKTKT